MNKFSFIGGCRGQHGALGIATPRRRGKEAPPQDIVSEESKPEETSSSEDADPNYLALFVLCLKILWLSRYFGSRYFGAKRNGPTPCKTRYLIVLHKIVDITLPV